MSAAERRRRMTAKVEQAIDRLLGLFGDDVLELVEGISKMRQSEVARRKNAARRSSPRDAPQIELGPRPDPRRVGMRPVNGAVK